MNSFSTLALSLLMSFFFTTLFTTIDESIFKDPPITVNITNVLEVTINSLFTASLAMMTWESTSSRFWAATPSPFDQTFGAQHNFTIPFNGLGFHSTLISTRITEIESNATKLCVRGLWENKVSVCLTIKPNCTISATLGCLNECN